MNAPTSPAPSFLSQTCFSTLGSAEYDFSATLALASEYSIKAIEIRCLAGKTIAPDNFALLFPPAPDALKQLKAAKIELTGLGTSVKLFDAQAGDLDVLTSFAQLADTLSCPWLRVFDGGKIGELPTPETWAKTQSFVSAWQNRRQQLGLKADIMVETHDGLTSIESAHQFRKLLPNTAILWDSHHTWRAGGESLKGYFDVARDAIVHIHAKDSMQKPSPTKPFTYCLPGEGEFPWEELAALVKEAKFAGKLSLEWERHWHPYLPPLTEAIPPFHSILSQW
jgi:sugar phosphate isomerase/epimerase